MFHRIVPLCLLLLFVPSLRGDDLPRAQPEQVGMSSEVLGKFKQHVQKAVDDQQIAGAVVLVMRKGKVAFLESVGSRDREAGAPMKPDTIFRIASMSKPITSAAILLLADQGKLQLSDPLSKYIPAFANPKVFNPMGDSIPAAREITIRDLLTHTSGLTYRFFNKPGIVDFYRQADICDGLTSPATTIGDNCNRLGKLPLMHQPGTAFEYGLSTDVLGRVIEVASGQALDVFMTESVFRPLGMKDTSFRLPADKKDRIAAVYAPGMDKKAVRLSDEVLQKEQLNYSPSYPYAGSGTYFSGGGGLISTAQDYARFCETIRGGGERLGFRFLKPETVLAMTSNQIGDLKMWDSNLGPRFGYGFGIVTQEGKGSDPTSVGSYSWGGFWSTYFWVDPAKELTCVLLTQLHPNEHLRLNGEFQKAVYDAIQR